MVPIGNIARNGAYVKARIIGSNIPMGVLAKAAGMSNGNLSNYLAGRVTFYPGQQKIFRAFKKLSGIRVSSYDFWGALASRPPRKRKAS